MFSFNQISFLGNVIAQFQAKTGKSMNYPCFLHNYFEIVSSEVWPCQKKIMESISHRLPKSFAARRRAKQEFNEWWAITTSVLNPTPTFVLINCVPCCRMTPLPLFPRNCVESLHHFLSALWLCVCNLFHFQRIFHFGTNKHHNPHHVSLRSRLLPPLVGDIFAESDAFLDRSSPAVQGDYMARFNYGPVTSNPVLV